MTTSNDKQVQCTRCRNEHLESERVWIRDRKDRSMTVSTCPRCGAHNFFRPEHKGLRWFHNAKDPK